MQEQFSYSLMASALGILIVFSILVLLSGVMILIRKLSDAEPKKKEDATQKPVSVAAVTQAAVQPQLPLPVMVAAAVEGLSGGTAANWLPAAVAAFFALEDDDASGPSATSWAASKYNKYDPWVANNKLSKTVPGV